MTNLPNTRLIPLTQGQFSIVDEDDFDRVNQFKWQAVMTANHFYARRCVVVNKKETCIFLHRFIMDAPKGLAVDHRNHNPLDNRKENLRICTQGQNAANCMTRRNGPRGVSYIEKSNKWSAKIKSKGISKYIGTFLTEQDAAEAYDAKAIEAFGEFAVLNNPSRL